MTHISKIKNLKTLFELRKTITLSKRICIGRVFFHKEKIGLCDSTCALWPIFLDNSIQKNTVKNGDVISFSYTFKYEPPSNEAMNKKYDDLHYILNLENIIEQISNSEEWKNFILPNPIEQFKDIETISEDYTCYYKSLTKNRFTLTQTRIKALERVKQFFTNRNFIQIETPTLVPSGGLEEYLNPFTTQYTDHRSTKIQVQLPTSPEFALKKILAELPSQIFQISRAYRNEGELSMWHEPEFFMLEWYRVGADLKDILNDTQNLVVTLANYLGSHIDIPKNWPRFRVDELFLKLMKLDLTKLQDLNNFYIAAKNLSISIVKTDSWNDIFCKLFMEKIEPFLKEQKACFVTHYPIQMAALAAIETSKDNEGKPTECYFAQRAEAFLYGVEICNAYLELTNANTLEQRILKTIKLRPELNRDFMFENAMKFGLPPCSGNALGIDRVIAILIGEKNISNLYAIPFLAQFIEGAVAKE